MSTPAAKRRRIDDASKTLCKPFRSPFKTPFKSPVKAQDGTTTPVQNTTPSAKLVLSSNPPKLPNTPLNLNRTPRLVSRKKQFSSPVSTAVLNADPAIAPLLRTQRDLERDLRALKEELDTAEQARKIERETKDGEVDGELKVLIEKWRGASREAAEEMFGKVRDRVNRYFLILLRLLLLFWADADFVSVERVDREPGKRCRKNSRNFRASGNPIRTIITKTTTKTTTMTKIQKREPRGKESCTINMMWT